MDATVTIPVTESLINDCIDYLSLHGKKPGTLNTYRNAMEKLYRYLPEPKELSEPVIQTWRASICADGATENYALQCASAAKILLKYASEQKTLDAIPRSDFGRLLAAARNERDALLIRLYASVDINVQDTKSITVEACKEGHTGHTAIPTRLCSDLLLYAEQQGIASGPIFLNRYGNPVYRTCFSRMLTNTAKRAGLDPAACHPSALRRMVRSTRDVVRDSLQPVYDEFQKAMAKIEADLTAAARPGYA